MTQTAPRFLIVDDHPIVRLGVRQLILKGWPGADIDEAGEIDKACARFVATRFDAVVLDVSMPDVSGSDGVARVILAAQGVPILILSANAESKNAARLLQMGAAGYLPKDRATDELIAALSRILEGKRYVTAAMADHLVDLLGSGKPGSALPHEHLSAQEHRVMLQVASGRSPSAIGVEMGISARTVGTYRARIFEKTGWRSNVELAKYCLQHGLIDDAG